jgi:hypothetical protein
MSHPVEEQLLGYVMGALDDSEREQVQESLKTDPRLRRGLAAAQRSLKPLRAARLFFAPPPGLAERTCRFVALHAAAESKGPAQPSRPVISPLTVSAGWMGRVRWLDLVMAVGLWLAAALLVLPAIHGSRFSSQLAACQDNLRKVGFALQNYSQRHQDLFPLVPPQGRLAVAGIYAPTLLRGGFLTESRTVVCPSSSLSGAARFRVPSLDELANAAQDELPRLRCAVGGSYGYCLGHLRNGVYEGTRNRQRPRFALISDAPSRDQAGHQSLNHGGRGQNVLFEDNHVNFLTSSKPCDLADDIFVNDDGLVAAGLQEDDAVIGPSDASPLGEGTEKR